MCVNEYGDCLYLEKQKLWVFLSLGNIGCAVVQAVSRRILTLKPRVYFQASRCGICGRQIRKGIVSSSSTSVFPTYYYSTSASPSVI
jgi:hypothetical protein